MTSLPFLHLREAPGMPRDLEAKASGPAQGVLVPVPGLPCPHTAQEMDGGLGRTPVSLGMEPQQVRVPGHRAKVPSGTVSSRAMQFHTNVATRGPRALLGAMAMPGATLTKHTAAAKYNSG